MRAVVEQPPEPITDIHACFNKMREDPDWGVDGPPRWNQAARASVMGSPPRSC